MQTTRTYNRTRQFVTLGILSAIAFGVMAVLRLPITSVEFLKFDLKDVIIVIGGFIFGPLSSFMMSLVVSILEMVTVSTSGPIGCIMNVLSSCAFACTASFIYKKRQSLRGAVLGLVAGAFSMTALMLLWNYFITPLYMGLPRSAVAGMLLPVFLPFNLIKSGINAAVAMLLYKPLVGALRKMNLVPESSAPTSGGKLHAGAIWVSLLVLASCILLVLVLRGII